MKECFKAYAKINISLDVVGKRENGYHNLKSVMQSVSLYDRIFINTDFEGIRIKSNLSYLPCDKRNIVFKAAELFYEKIGKTPSADIYIDKKIPMGAGLGGGSADAAATLLGLNKMHNFTIESKRLEEIGLSCGADVVFCMRGKTHLAEGVGEILTPLPPMPECHIVLIKPSLSISTKTVFENFSLSECDYHPDTDGIIEALSKKDLHALSIRAFNVLEKAVEPRYKDLVKYKSELLSFGALGSCMSGSGSAVFGIFTSQKEAKKAVTHFKKAHKAFAFSATPIN